MGGVKKVTQLSDDRLEWVAEIAGVRRQWTATILEQVPDRKVAWAATEGATNAGAVTFEDVGGGQTSVQLSLEYEPEGLLEKVGDKLNIVENQVKGDLDRFKAFIESEGYASGAWRGSVNEGATSPHPGSRRRQPPAATKARPESPAPLWPPGSGPRPPWRQESQRPLVPRREPSRQRALSPYQRSGVDVGRPLEATPAPETSLPAESADPTVPDVGTAGLGTTTTGTADDPADAEGLRRDDPARRDPATCAVNRH